MQKNHFFIEKIKNTESAQLWTDAYKDRALSGAIILVRAGHFRYFWIFSLIKNDFFAFFIKLIWLGVGFLNRTGAVIDD